MPAQARTHTHTHKHIHKNKHTPTHHLTTQEQEHKHKETQSEKEDRDTEGETRKRVPSRKTHTCFVSNAIHLSKSARERRQPTWTEKLHRVRLLHLTLEEVKEGWHCLGQEFARAVHAGTTEGDVWRPLNPWIGKTPGRIQGSPNQPPHGWVPPSCLYTTSEKGAKPQTKTYPCCPWSW